MSRWRALIYATVLEILGEPFVLLVTLAALVLAVLAPTFHYHQFGEPSRMARDAGLSALILGGAALAIFAPIKTYRREIETGTILTALALPVSRTTFFLAKFIGLTLAYCVFILTILCTSLTIVNGAEIGGAFAAVRADIARLWGPSLSFALAVLILPIFIAAILNRFARFRFTLSANLIAFILSFVGTFYRFDFSLARRFLPVALLATIPAFILLAAASTFAIRMRSNAATSATALVALALIPALGNYCLSDALTDGGAISFSYFLCALAAALPILAALLLLGITFLKGRDLT